MCSIKNLFLFLAVTGGGGSGQRERDNRLVGVPVKKDSILEIITATTRVTPKVLAAGRTPSRRGERATYYVMCVKVGSPRGLSSHPGLRSDIIRTERSSHYLAAGYKIVNCNHIMNFQVSDKSGCLRIWYIREDLLSGSLK